MHTPLSWSSILSICLFSAYTARIIGKMPFWSTFWDILRVVREHCFNIGSYFLIVRPCTLVQTSSTWLYGNQALHVFCLQKHANAPRFSLVCSSRVQCHIIIAQVNQTVFHTAKDGEIIPSTIVFVRDKDGRYVKGFVSSRLQNRFTVKTYNGPSVIVSIHDTPGIVPDKMPLVNEVHVGSPVIGSWKGTDRWYFGRVMNSKQENNTMLFNVLFDDGDEIWHNLENIRIVGLKHRDGMQTNPLILVLGLYVFNI